jgi:hypothetical protein
MARKNTGIEPSRVLFMYTQATAGGYVEELLRNIAIRVAATVDCRRAARARGSQAPPG